MAARRLALIGKPVSHSLSPPMYNGFFSDKGLNIVYDAIEVSEGEVGGVIGRLRSSGYIGFNVTMPHKKVIAGYLDELDVHASEIGAVNTVKLGSRAIGFNTDWLGVLGPLRDVAGLRSPVDTTLVLGAGGAGSAAVYAIAAGGLASRVYVSSRSGLTSRELAFKASSRWGLDAEHVDIDRARSVAYKADIVVNATPVGWGDGRSPIEGARFKEGCVAFDMVYKPLFTRLLLEAASRGCIVVDGLWMLVYQASENLRIWLGLEASPVELRSYAASRLRGGGAA